MIVRLFLNISMRLLVLRQPPHDPTRPRQGKDTSDCVSAGRSDADVFQTEQNLVEQVQGLVHEEVHEVGRRLAPHSRINDLKTHSW